MFEELLKTSKSMLQGVDTYLSFAENRLARAAVTRLNPSPGGAMSGSLTMIYGPPGVGKTHLALWTLNRINRRQRDAKLACASIKNLCEMMQRADDNQCLAELLEQFQTLDVLIAEDLQWLEQAPFSQPWFVMLIETLESCDTPVLITSHKPAGEFRPLDRRLVSRCHGGLCVPMPLVSLESRILLLQQWFRELQLPILKPFVASARYLAERLPVTPRELRQAVLELKEQQARQPSAIDVAYLERWLSKENRSPRLSFDSIVGQVAIAFGVEPADLRSRSRQQSLALPRQCAMLLARTDRPTARPDW